MARRTVLRYWRIISVKHGKRTFNDWEKRDASHCGWARWEMSCERRTKRIYSHLFVVFMCVCKSLANLQGNSIRTARWENESKRLRFVSELPVIVVEQMLSIRCVIVCEKDKKTKTECARDRDKNGAKKVCETFWMRKSEQSMLLHENQHRFGRIVFFSIVFALVKSMLLFHLGDLLLTFSSSLATKHTTQCHTFVLRITYFPVCACILYDAKIPCSELQKWSFLSLFISLFLCTFFSHALNSNVCSAQWNKSQKKLLKHWLHAEAAAHSNYTTVPDWLSEFISSFCCPLLYYAMLYFWNAISHSLIARRSFAMKCAQKYLHINNNMIKMSLIELASERTESERRNEEKKWEEKKQ